MYFLFKKTGKRGYLGKLVHLLSVWLSLQADLHDVTECLFNGFSVDSDRQTLRRIGCSHAVRTQCYWVTKNWHKALTSAPSNNTLRINWIVSQALLANIGSQSHQYSRLNGMQISAARFQNLVESSNQRVEAVIKA